VGFDRRSIGTAWARGEDAGMGRARLSALDGSFLRVETPTAHMHVAWKGIFEPRKPPHPPVVSVEELRRAIAGRLRHMPRFRQRLAFTGGWAGLLA